MICITARERQTCFSASSGNWRDPGHWRLNAGPQQRRGVLGGSAYGSSSRRGRRCPQLRSRAAGRSVSSDGASGRYPGRERCVARPGAVARRLPYYHILGLYFPCTIQGRRVLLFKSGLHLDYDGPQFPVRRLMSEIAQAVEPRVFITTGTGGGIGANVNDAFARARPRSSADIQFSLRQSLM